MSVIDLRSKIRVNQGGTNACIYLVEETQAQHLWVGDDQIPILTPPIDSTQFEDRGMVVKSGQDSYLIPAYLTIYQLNQDKMNQIIHDFQPSKTSEGYLSWIYHYLF